MYGSKVMYAVFVNDEQMTPYNLTEHQAEVLAKEYEDEGYDLVDIVESEVEDY